MNICIISSHFPSYDIPGTEKYATGFLFQYAKEWVRQGHRVRIYDLHRIYPSIFKIIVNVTSKFGIDNLKKYLQPKEAETENTYTYEGVEICRILYRKYIPHALTDRFQVSRIVRLLLESIENSNDKCELIIGDCFDPVLQVVAILKTKLQCKYYQVLHNSDFIIADNKEIIKCSHVVDKWLLRSYSQIDLFKSHSISDGHEIKMMFSGMEKNMINPCPVYRNKITKLLYVGTLMKSKGLSTILDALELTSNKNLKLTIVGSGVDEGYFKEYVEQKRIIDNVCFVGQKPHNEVLQLMNKADSLVLISHETFGMVYVEAMSQSCIPIGTCDEGIDGIVKNGQNGFLCPLGDSKTLSSLFDSFQSIETETVKEISRKAYETASTLTMERLAAELLV